jgi:hypothetical protein
VEIVPNRWQSSSTIAIDSAVRTLVWLALDSPPFLLFLSSSWPGPRDQPIRRRRGLLGYRRRRFAARDGFVSFVSPVARPRLTPGVSVTRLGRPSSLWEAYVGR